MLDDADRLSYRPDEAAALLGVSRTYFFKHVRPYVRAACIGRATLIPRTELVAFLAERTSSGARGAPAAVLERAAELPLAWTLGRSFSGPLFAEFLRHTLRPTELDALGESLRRQLRRWEAGSSVRTEAARKVLRAHQVPEKELLRFFLSHQAGT